MLRDLTVQNYRCFENFHIDGLERVNLFVGKNNSGKTSLLEAIYLSTANNKYDSLLEILLNRREVIVEHTVPRGRLNKNQEIISIFHHIESVNHLFYDYKLKEGHEINIWGSNKELIDDNQDLITNIYFDHYETQESLLIAVSNANDPSPIVAQWKIQKSTNSLLIENDETSIESKDNKIFLGNKKIELEQMQLFWNNIYLTIKEDRVVQALKIIEPQIERIGFYHNQLYSIVRFKIEGYNHPIPLSSMGDGMYHILTLAMSLVSAENGVLLVDEIETGLHYEAQTDMWRLILETAKELNVQVFATTHSWDCIAAFQEALEQVEDSSIGKLFRLDSKYGKLRAVEYNAEDLEIVTRESIEVR